MIDIRCRGCNKTPDELDEYISQYEEMGCASPTDMVIQEEGTFDPATNRFWCTVCYIQAGMPLNRF